MARKRRKKKSRYSQPIALLLAGSLITLCGLSIMYGFLIRKSIAEDQVEQFRIEILNGTGQDGLAGKVALSLRKKGIDVFRVENAPDFGHKESILISRKEKEGLDNLARVLGCDNVIEQTTEDSIVDATLILGSDYRSLKLGIDFDSSLPE
jgi:hypothetical protein